MLAANVQTKVFLHPGEFYFGDPGVHVHTLLGSCIAISIWHPRLHTAGLCHFVLPTRTSCRATHALDGRYGDDAMEMFRKEAKNRKTNLNEYQAKIFGGSNMLKDTRTAEEDLIGMRNAEAALTMLMAEGVEILVVHVGETGHRRIILDIESGDVWCRHETADGHRMASTSGLN